MKIRRKVFSDTELETPEKDKEKKALLDRLKGGSGAVAVLGSGSWGASKLAKKLQQTRDAKLKDGTLEKWWLTKVLGIPEKPADLQKLEKTANISKYLAGTGAAVYGTTKAYEHFKNKKNKKEEEKED